MRRSASRVAWVLSAALLCAAVLVPASVGAQQLYPPPPRPVEAPPADVPPETPPLVTLPEPAARRAPPPSDSAPVLAPGAGQVLVDGVLVELIIRAGLDRLDPNDPVLRLIGALRLSDDGTRVLGFPPRADGSPREPLVRDIMLIQFGDTALVLMAEDMGDNVVAIGPDEVLVLVRSGRVIGSGAGFEPDSELDLWFFSDALLLSSNRTLDDGTLALVTALPADAELGRHVLQFTGHVGVGVPFELSIDVRLEDAPMPAADLLSPLGLLLALAALGVLLLLFLLLRRRRGDEFRMSLAVQRGHVGSAAGVGLRPGLAAATLSRSPTPVELRPAASATAPLDPALLALGSRIEGGDLIDLATDPVPLGSVLLAGSGAVTIALAVVDGLGVSRPLEAGVLRLNAGDELLMAGAGLLPGSAVWLGLGASRAEDEAARLGDLRAGDDGRVRGRLALPEGAAVETGDESVLLVRARVARRGGPEGT
jgi:hypothetical protein